MANPGGSVERRFRDLTMEHQLAPNKNELWAVAPTVVPAASPPSVIGAMPIVTRPKAAIAAMAIETMGVTRLGVIAANFSAVPFNPATILMDLCSLPTDGAVACPIAIKVLQARSVAGKPRPISSEFGAMVADVMPWRPANTLLVSPRRRSKER